MADISLTVTARPPKTKAKDLRSAGRVPGVLYGYKVENMPLDCDYKELHHIYIKAGESTVVHLDIEGSSIPVLIHQLDLDPVSGDYAHIDFFAINMKKKVTANVPILSEGISPAVKDLAAILFHDRDTVSVHCLPKDLPHDITIDLSSLKEYGDTITVVDLSVEDAVEIDEDPKTVIASVQQPRIEKEPEEAEATEAEGEGEKEGEGEDGEKKEKGKEGEGKKEKKE